MLDNAALSPSSLATEGPTGHAVDLAGHDSIAVYPVGGWWKSHVGQQRITDKGRYALVISVSAPGQAVNLHAEVANLVQVKEIELLIG